MIHPRNVAELVGDSRHVPASEFRGHPSVTWYHFLASVLHCFPTGALQNHGFQEEFFHTRPVLFAPGVPCKLCHISFDPGGKSSGTIFPRFWKENKHLVDFANPPGKFNVCFLHFVVSWLNLLLLFFCGKPPIWRIARNLGFPQWVIQTSRVFLSSAGRRREAHHLKPPQIKDHTQHWETTFLLATLVTT